MSLLFALITETALVKESDLYVIARAVEDGAIDCATAWFKEPPAVDVFHARRALPDGCCPVVFIDDKTDPDALADHYLDLVRLLPAARVWPARASGLVIGPTALSVLTSHEVNEALCDPDCTEFKPHPSRPGVHIAQEVCDPTQDAYNVDTANGSIAVANFVFPAYFDASLADFGAAQAFRDAGKRFDFRGSIGYAGQIGPDGYQILADETHIWDEGPSGPFNARADRADRVHPWSRTARRHTWGGPRS